MRMSNKRSKCLKSGAVVKAIKRFTNYVLAFGVKVNGTVINFL